MTASDSQPKCSGAEAPALAGSGAAEQRDSDAGPGDERDDPAVVTREDGGDESDGDEDLEFIGLRDRNVCAIEGGAPLDQPDDDPDEFAQKERLGHGRCLQIEEIGIEREKDERKRRRARGRASCAPGDSRPTQDAM